MKKPAKKHHGVKSGASAKREAAAKETCWHPRRINEKAQSMKKMARRRRLEIMSAGSLETSQSARPENKYKWRHQCEMQWLGIWQSRGINVVMAM